jgi:radical SAM superfamily enzyme YgiQ (UPF0313 family)
MKLTVGLCQINASFSGHSYLPYSTGLLEAYARKHLANAEDYEFLPPIFSREAIDSAVEKLLPADVAGFSLYVWNNQLSLAIMKELKARKPEIVIIVGGPHVPDRIQRKMAREALAQSGKTDMHYDASRVEAYLREHPFIDLACHGEGERTFTAFLEEAQDDWRKIPSVSFLGADGSFVQTERLARTRSLEEFPSPYLEGTFDPLIEANPEMQWIGTWETNRGCPFSCAFCDWGSYVASKVNSWPLDHVYAEAEWFVAHKVEFIFLADANFGILPRDVDIAQYCAEMKARTGYPKAITVSNTKNATERSYAVQKIFAESGLNTGATISMQSMDTETLKAIKRDNISLDSFKEIQRRMKSDGIQATTDIILALPGETYDSFANGVDELITNGQHDRILFYHLTILPNAEMADPAYQEAFGMEMVQSRSINIHGSRKEIEHDVPELQEVVVATNTLSRADWVRMRVFSWMTAFLHFDKVLQIPLLVTHALTGISYREIIELFAEGQFGNDFPTLQSVQSFMIEKARSIQAGGEEFCHSSEWLDMWWPSDEYALIDLVATGRRAAFYGEAALAFESLLDRHGKEEYKEVIRESLWLNAAMFKLPGVRRTADFALRFNTWQLYQKALSGEAVAVRQEDSIIMIEREQETWPSLTDWARHVVWYGSKRGAYLYGTTSTLHLAGHF